jgi:hypothetical protein
MVSRAILLVALTVFNSAGIIRADEASKADIAFVGKIIKFGPVALGPPGGAFLCGTKIKVSQALRGAAGNEVSITIHAYPNSGYPRLKLGDSAIFLVRKVAVPDPDPYVAVKILPATGDNIAKVKKLISD